ncbi:hypothetical protein OQA88_6937 [Cercophora sp. LCS_1]
MAVFVDLEEEQDIQSPHDGRSALDPVGAAAAADEVDPNQNSLTKALGCYPIIMSIAANIDLNTLDSLSRTCRQVHAGVIQYRKMLLVSTLHCINEPLPVDPEETLRFRARAGNWFYMEDTPGRTGYNGKSGQCARDLNCAIKPPAPIVLRDRHRRLCNACTKAPLGNLVKPRLGADITLDSESLERAVCSCVSEGVWLCQPCGRSIRSDDNDYKSIWKWRNQYTDYLGGLGTGIGEGDRGVICGRENLCCASREREQETDCDAADLRDAEALSLAGSIPLSHSSSDGSLQPWSSPGSASSSSEVTDRRTPSPQLGPGYERHEIEGIGGVVKKKLLRMVKIGACVPEWDNERQKGDILGREVRGERRSWCGWCWRVVPGQEDHKTATKARLARDAKEAKEGGSS